MCIIAYKPAGVKLPNKKTFRAMFENNPDGAGFMYAENGRVYIQKGFMEYNEFRRAIKPLIGRNDLPIVFHFRIATHGGINARMCQPFPLAKREKTLKLLNTSCDIGIAHNGIIPMTMDAREISDTALFIKKYACRILENGIDSISLDIIENCIDSKMAILENNGKCHLLGYGWKTENGIHYSNDSYKARKYKVSYTTARKTAIYDYDSQYYYNDSYNTGAFCDNDCSVCGYKKYCFSTDTDLNARDMEI